MTIQNWSLSEDRAAIVCDSLVSLLVDGRNVPGHAVSKCWIVPHLSLIIGVKEWVGPALALWQWLAIACPLTSWREIVAAAPDVLRQAGDASPLHRSLADESRIVMFGFDDRSRSIRGVLFEGERAFQPLDFPQGEILIPDVEGIRDCADDHARVMKQQRADNMLPIADRDNIGGAVIRVELTAPKGCPAISVNTICRLPHTMAGHLLGQLAPVM